MPFHQDQLAGLKDFLDEEEQVQKKKNIKCISQIENFVQNSFWPEGSSSSFYISRTISRFFAKK